MARGCHDMKTQQKVKINVRHQKFFSCALHRSVDYRPILLVSALIYNASSAIQHSTESRTQAPRVLSLQPEYPN